MLAFFNPQLKKYQHFIPILKMYLAFKLTKQQLQLVRHEVPVGLLWLRDHRHLTENKGCGFNPQPPMPAIFQPRITKKSTSHPQ